MEHLTGTVLMLTSRDFNILGVTSLRSELAFTLILHTSGGADPMLVLRSKADIATVISALQREIE